MKYLATIKRLRLKYFWEEGSTNHQWDAEGSQWNVLINCGKKAWIGLYSENPPTVHYYRQSAIMSQKMQGELKNIGCKIEKLDGESMTYCPLNKLPDLCKIVKAKKKRKMPSPEQLEKMIQTLNKVRPK